MKSRKPRPKTAPSKKKGVPAKRSASASKKGVDAKRPAGAPRILSFRKNGVMTAEARWTKVPRATSYRARYWVRGIGARFKKLPPTADTHVEISMSYADVVDFCVSAENSHGEGPRSEVVTAYGGGI